MIRIVSKNKNYTDFLNTIKSRIRTARISAARTVNKELITLYWSIRRAIAERKEQLELSDNKFN